MTTHALRGKAVIHGGNSSAGAGRRHAEARFTLTELLLVIGVIVILVGLLLPAFADVRRKGREAGCKGNLRQIAQGAMVYINDHNGHVLPSYLRLGSDEVSFMVYLFNSGLDSSDIFKCPEHKDVDLFEPGNYNSDPSKKQLSDVSYMINTINNWEGNSSCPTPDLTSIDSDLTTLAKKERAKGWTSEGNAYSPLRMVKARNPAGAVYVLDFIRKVESYEGTAGSKTNRGNDASSFSKWCETDHGALPTDTGEDRRDVGEHHSGGANALYGDGHAELLRVSNPEQWIVWLSN